MRNAIMNDENKSSNVKDPILRITRARAKVLGSSGGLPPLHPLSKQDGKRKCKRADSKYKTEESSESCPQRKKRAVFKDVTNVTCENLYTNCINATRVQPIIKQDRKASTQKKQKVEPACVVKQSLVPKKGNTMSEMNTLKIEESKETSPDKINHISLPMPATRDDELCKKLEDKDIIDIDSEHDDPLMSSIYAAEIYSSLHTTQFDRRPLVDYMKKLQRDVTKGMRGILIDWLVEVSEEYKLLPDTLYLTVNLIDRFLSESYIEKRRLQLVGVTCMLIASKYEEICAPQVGEFCFITDNSYKKEEVMSMESDVLNILGFQLSVPTTKKFLRRFIQAAQVSSKVSSVELEFMANYLSELTLIEYNFLKFLPSLIAASAVFLARWTLDQSEHPWNSTLEHYTRHNTSELKSAVLELEELQLNTSGSLLNAIREKYKQSKIDDPIYSTLKATNLVNNRALIGMFTFILIQLGNLLLYCCATGASGILLELEECFWDITGIGRVSLLISD